MMLWYAAALATGVASSLHCIGMCGPLALALPVGRFPAARRGLARSLYHGGRLAAYALLGAGVGAVGQGLLFAGLQRPVSIGAGVVLLVWAVAARAVPAWLRGSPAGRRLTAPLARLLRQPTLPHMAGLGFLNGLLPCGSVYVALAGALAVPGPAGGAMYLLVFGLGTLPAMLGVGLVVSRLAPLVRRRLGRVLPVATVAVALLLIVRGTGLPGRTARAGGVPACPHCAVPARP